MAHYIISRDGDVFTGYKYMDTGEKKPVFKVKGSKAARAVVKLFEIITPIQDYFFDNPHGSHLYNASDKPESNMVVGL